MGAIEFEGWGVELDDIDALNRASEVSRLGLIFKQQGDYVGATAQGNVSTYYCILAEVRSRIVSGGFIVAVNLSSGEERKIKLSANYVIENGEDISSFIR